MIPIPQFLATNFSTTVQHPSTWTARSTISGLLANMSILLTATFLVAPEAIAQTSIPSKPGNVVIPTQPLPSQPLATAGVCPAQLPARLNAIANRLPSVRWGILVQTLSPPATRLTFYAKNPETLLTPASNNKLFTTAAALQKLGPQYRIRTSVTGNSTGPNLALLRIIGRGDPSLKTTHMNVLAQRLNRQGIRQVALLVGDDTYFQGAAVNPNWSAEDTLEGFGAPVNSLMINQNGIGLTLFPQRVGQPLRVQWDDPTDAQSWRLNNQSVTVAAGVGEFVSALRDRPPFQVKVEGQLQAGAASEPVAAAISNPGNYLVQKFRNALAAANISVTQSTLVRATPAPLGEVELATLDSPPLNELLKETNQESNNIYAEALLKTLGVVQTPNNSDATASGIAAVKTILTPLGVNPARYSMVDGSGLADKNRASAEAFARTLQALGSGQYAPVFRASLPVAGVSGTLKSRFRGTAAQGRLQAKTGTISGVVSLSGYLTPPNYPPLVVSFLANYSSGSAATVRSAVDEMVLVLVQLRSC